MTVLVSARPLNLQKYVTDTRGISTTAKEDIGRLRGSWDAFAAAANEFGPTDTGLLAEGAGGVLDQQLDRWQRQEDFVELVKTSFEEADRLAASHHGHGWPLVTIGDWRLDWYMQDQARRRGIDLSQLFSDPGSIGIPEPLRGTPIPHDSGFVEDPVCTATGHFVDTALDVAMPQRLQVLAWPRVYSSAHTVRGGHGRGWGSWASVACVRQADGSLAYTGPDGQRLRLRPYSPRTGQGRDGAGGGWRRTTWLRATAIAIAPDSGDAAAGVVELRWDRESPHPGETWVFRADGTLAEVRSPENGTTTAAYDHGRLARLTHEGGRHLDVHWVSDRIARVVSSCGRTVEYRYDERGDLVEVASAREPRRYDLDARGRVVAVWDADGVRLCHNTYDQRNRVRRQESPFGRTTTFAYGAAGSGTGRNGRTGGPDLVTVVGDTDGGPESRWEHDRQGRLIGLVDAEGHRMTRTFDADGRCLSVTGFDGATVTYAYDDGGRMTSRCDGRGEERFHHDDHGRVVRHERPDGSWTAYEYTDGTARPRRACGPEGWEQVVDRVGGVVRRITDADGVALEIESDGAGCPTAVTDGLGHTTRFVVHPSGEVAAVTLPDGATWVADRDDAGRPTAITQPDGHRTETHWTPAGRLRQVVAPDGTRTRYHHGPHGEVDTVTDPRGHTLHLTYEHLERLVELASPPSEPASIHPNGAIDPAGPTGAAGPDGSAGGRRWGLEHSALGLVTAVHDPGGHTWRLDHDAEGRTKALIDPLGHERAYGYDAVGDLVREVDPGGGITHRVRDEAGRVVAVVDPEGGTTRLTYDLLGRVTRVESPDGGVVERRYTAAGRLAEEVTGEGRGRRLRYDAAGRLVEEVDALGGSTTYERDPVGRVVGITGPDGRTQRLTYDAAGRVAAAEVDGSVWRTTYDHDGRVTAAIDPLGATTRFAYDAAGNLVAATDPLGHSTTYEWDDQGHCSAITDPLGHTTRYRRDERGLCVAAVDALGQVTTYRFDAAGRPVGVALPDGSCVDHVLDPAGRLVELDVDGQPVLTQAFDRCGRPLEVAEPTRPRTHHLSWSPSGHLLTLTTTPGPTSHGGWRWRYDGDGLVVAAVGPDGRTTTYGYDLAGRLVEQVSDGVPVQLERDAAGRVVVLDAAGLHRELHYDAAGRLARQTRRTLHTDGPTGAVPVQSSEYERDAAGRVVAVRHGHGVSTYGYDAAGQLVLACDGDAGGQGWSFGYDAGGRLVAEHRPDGWVRRYRYDILHRLVGVTGSDAATFGYDALGRRTYRTDATGTIRYRWDPLGRLARIEREDGERRTLDVDAFGSLVAVDGTPLTWNPNAPVPELRSLGPRAVVTVDGTPLALTTSSTTPDTPTATTIAGPAPSAGGPTGTGAAPTTAAVRPDVTWLAGDWRGSAHPTDPWGLRVGPDVASGAGGLGGVGPGFLGEVEIDGLVWLRNRVYDPGSRQFLSPDPLAGDPGSPVLTHPYHYAANDPIGHADPLGLAPMSIDAYKQYKKVTTGIQWKNVVFAAEVALSVALMFTPLGPANAARMFAMAGPRIALSSGTKMAGMAINGSAQTAVWELAGQKLDEELAWSDVRWGTVAKGTVFGGVGTMLGGAVGPRLGANVVSPVVGNVLRIPGKPANVVSSLTTSSTLLGTTSAGYEAYDLTDLPGSDGVFKPTNVIASTISAVPYTVAGGFAAPVRPAP